MINYKSLSVLLFAFSALLPLSIASQPYERTALSPKAVLTQNQDCFAIEKNRTYTVSKEVSSLSDAYSYCVNVTTKVTGTKVRVILVIDETASMCSDGAGSCVGYATNDPTNMRIEAARSFLDTLARRSPNSELGIVRYGKNSRGLIASSFIVGPLPVNTELNKALLRSAIDSSACPITYSGPTITGQAIDSALVKVDVNYPHVVADSLARHIIVLTDGAWADSATSSPAQILKRYRLRNPDRPLPKINGVFIADSARHVQYGFPPAGLFTCLPRQEISLNNLKAITADSTKGFFIAGSTPATIVATFQRLLQLIVQTESPLQSVIINNLTNGQSQNATSFTAGTVATDTYRQYVVQFSNPLQINYGINKLVMQTVVKKDSLTTTTALDTFFINRSTQHLANPDLGIFTESTAIDTIHLDINNDTSNALPGNNVTLSALLDPRDSTKFAPNAIDIRAIIPFDNYDSHTLSLFHLNRNVLDATGNGNGTGTPSYNDSAAFDFCLNRGQSFPFALITSLTANFTAEAYIKIAPANPALRIISGAGVVLEVNAERKLQFTVGTTTIVSDMPLDANVWQHVAVSRRSGTLYLYVNGLPVSATGVAFAGTVAAGSFSVGAAANAGLIDEVRISDFSRTEVVNGVTALELPVANTMYWTVAGVKDTAASATLPFAMWYGNPKWRLSFMVSSPENRDIMVNMRHPDPANAQWSKMSDPISFFKNDPFALDSAFTHDIDGNGYLDSITLYFSKKIKLSPAATFTITDSGLSFTVANLTSLTNTTDSVFGLKLTEIANGRPQTGLTPLLSIYNIINLVDTVNLLDRRVLDNAAPVIWTVEKQVTDLDNPAMDLVTVTFSENIRSSWRTSGFDAGRIKPDSAFYVYTRSTSGIFTQVPAALLNIAQCQSIGDRNKVQFYMDNGFNLTSQYWFNIKRYTDPNPVVDWTARKNIPLLSNQKVQVQVHKLYLQKLDSAFTADTNGNGLLDRVVVYFRQPHTITDSTYIVVRYKDVNFTIANMADLIRIRTDSVFVINLSETDTSYGPQTSWEPFISFYNIFNDTVKYDIIDSICHDKAGPVIWSVTKQIMNLDKRTEDRVTVTFSEDIRSYNTGNFDANNLVPESLLVIYLCDSLGNSCVENDSMLAGIRTFIPSDNKNQIVFIMTNGKDLTDRYRVAIRSTTTTQPPLVDRSFLNKPNDNNQKVLVRVIGAPTKKLIPFPNPATASFAHNDWSIAVHSPNARKWIIDDNYKGSIFTFTLAKPADNDTIRALMRIYDVVGNLVAWAINENFMNEIPDSRKQNSTFEVDLYWNGLNQKNMRAASGIYRAILSLEYRKNKNLNTRLVGNVGMR